MKIRKKKNSSGKTRKKKAFKKNHRHFSKEGIILMVLMQKILAAISSTDKATVMTTLASVKTLLQTYSINLSPEDMHKYQSAGIVGQAFIDAAKRLGGLHPETVPTDVDMANLTMIGTFKTDMLDIKSELQELIEIVNDVITYIGFNEMHAGNRIYDQGKVVAKGNSNLNDEVVALGDTRYKRSGKIKPTDHSIAASGRTEVHGTVPGSLFINWGKSVVKLLAGGELSSKVKVDAMLIYPGSSVRLPAGYTSIIVENQSANDEGNFAVKIRS